MNTFYKCKTFKTHVRTHKSDIYEKYPCPVNKF